MPGFPSSAALRTEALGSRITRRELAAHRRQRRGGSRPGVLVRFVLLPVIGVVAVLVGVLALVVGIAEEIGSDHADRRSEAAVMVGIVVTMVLTGVLLLVFALRARRQRLRPRAHLRLARFARDNGLVYTPGPVASVLLGRIRDRGVLTVRSRIDTDGTPRVEAGNFELGTGEQGRETRFGGYCALRLPRRLPNLVLLAQGLRAHPMTDAAPPAAAQRLRLEGDFDRTFRLYCPAGYERDALVLITPDVMARLLDTAGGWDVEVVDDLLVLSRSDDVVGLDPEAWRRLAAIVDALDDKVARWARWRESRTEAMPAITGTRVATEAPVAEQGARLRPGLLRLVLVVVLPLALMAVVVLSRLLDG